MKEGKHPVSDTSHPGETEGIKEQVSASCTPKGEGITWKGQQLQHNIKEQMKENIECLLDYIGHWSLQDIL